MKRIEREKKTVGQMVRIYCHRKHADTRSGEELCPECQSLLEYAFARLDRCPKGSRKSSCRKCEIHCYAPSRRDEIRLVMKFSGPRMAYLHPVAAFRHLFNELRPGR